MSLSLFNVSFNRRRNFQSKVKLDQGSQTLDMCGRGPHAARIMHLGGPSLTQ
jgi:hypothetical protein